MDIEMNIRFYCQFIPDDLIDSRCKKFKMILNYIWRVKTDIGRFPNMKLKSQMVKKVQEFRAGKTSYYIHLMQVAWTTWNSV